MANDRHFTLGFADIVTSACGHSTGVYAINGWRYCPWCGVRVDKDVTKVVFVPMQRLDNNTHVPLGVFFKKHDVDKYISALGVSSDSVIVHTAQLDPQK